MIHLFSKRTDSSGFSDEELRAAAQAVRNSMLQSLEETAEPQHTFSESFLRRMRELLRLDQRRNSRRRALQHAAVFLLGVFISGALFLAFNSEARAEFTRWVRDVYEKSILYQFFIEKSDEEPLYTTPLPDIEFTWLPGEYDIQVVHSSPQRRRILLIGSGDSMMLEYWLTEETGYLEFFTDNYQQEDVIINDSQSDFYLSNDINISNMLIWTSQDDTIVFSLSSMLPKETMVKIAEKISIN